ncbi:5-formyltetrahydrofolate cyclo-ligase [Desulfurobacterium atlanticum]|uniref:5-formyltetrahydrofolate cyclo-ligase n=1 Tax=Desulfurobacterium atlanticum TaxID=240169 RepID=A0A238Y517_9BACT|nr:5-formyltetrahydrofolate cyclo-ligase [Desulfurobacterium atlanticum]SNR66072.1 5-formyltetrahydrofolate cyclo-ligase [Desulfurobacterium atlanticum]
MKELKAEIRKRIKEKRLLLDKTCAEKLSIEVCGHILNIENLLEFSSFLLYYPHKGEVSLLSLFSFLKDHGKRVLFPKVVGKEIIPIEVSSLDELSKGFKGIFEPVFLSKSYKPDVVFVPGIAFDLECYRLGYGGGFYDRFLSGKDYFKVGVCFDFQIIDRLPVEPFDVPVDVVVSEKRVIRRKKWNS